MSHHTRSIIYLISKQFVSIADCEMRAMCMEGCGYLDLIFKRKLSITRY